MKKGVKLVLIVSLIAVLLILSVYGLDAITPTHADGIIIYSANNIQTPRYRTWNQSNDFSAELNAQDVGEYIRWVVTKSNHKRNEIIMGVEDRTENINVQVYNSSEEWTNLLEVSINAPDSSDSRAFDIAIEQNSGDVLIVYETSTNDDNIISYRIWNGTEYSTEQTLTTGLTNSRTKWLSLTPKSNSDKIMLLVVNRGDYLYAVEWNGTGFDTTKQEVLSTNIVSNDEQHFAFAWEEQSGKGLVVYRKSSDLIYRTYSSITGFNAINNTISLNSALDAVRMCSEPESDHIGIIWQNGDNVQVRIWNNAMLPNSPAEEGETEANGAHNANIDCAWINSTTALFGFIDYEALSIDYVFFTKANTWSTNDLETTYNTGNFATDDIKSLRFTKHPTTEEIMITTIDIKEDISAIRWDGTNFVNITASPIEDDTEVPNGAQEAVMFDWSRYDSPPSINQVSPTNGSSYNISNTVNITANVTDNIGVDTVIAAITFTGGMTDQITLLDADGDDIFSALYTIPAIIGNYNITFTANDTKNNIATIETEFNVNDVVSPTILLNNPENNFNTTSTTVIFNFTAADDSYTTLNCSLELNGAVNQINSTTQNGTLTSFVVLGLAEGNHQWNINCNDNSSNFNISETRNFIVDTSAPNINSLTTNPNSTDDLDPGMNIDVFANVTDTFTAVQTVVLQYKLNNETTYTNQTMIFSLGLYNATFNAALEGIYNLRIWTKDIVSNSNFSSVINLTVETETSNSTPKGPWGGGGGGAGTSSAGSSSGSATGGGVGGMSGGPVIEQEGEAVYSTARIIIQKGETKTIPIRLTNHHENAVLEDIKIKIIGLNANNIKVTPKINPDLKIYTETKTLKLKQGEHKAFEFTEIGAHTVKIENISSNSAEIVLDYKSLLDAEPIYIQLKINETKEAALNKDGENNVAIQLKEIKNKTINLQVYKIGTPDPEKIYFGEEREYEVSIFIPKYTKKQELNTTIRITADIIPINPQLAGFESKPLTKYRTLLIKIIEISEEKARSGLEKAAMDIEMMKTAKFATTVVETLLEQAKQAYAEKDYDLTHKLTEKISTLKKQAFEADKIIKEVQKGIDEAGLSESKKDEIQQKLLLAQISFENEDYETALKKAKEAQKILDIATKGKIIWFLTNNWWGILILLGATGWYIKKKRKK